MDNLNENARLHSAGATVRHTTPFDSLTTFKNEGELTGKFIRKWAVPYYMEICSDNSEWITSLRQIKNEITEDISLALLGDFNWRTRLMGTYFAAVKGYEGLIDIIGTHLLKSELCCVGHIYALVLTFFNNEKSIYYLNNYLDYYLTKPFLYFDQKDVMEALLYLDKVNNTAHFNDHLANWNKLQQERKPLEEQSTIMIAEIIENVEGKAQAEEYLNSLTTSKEEQSTQFTTTFFDEQVAILKSLNS